MPTPDLSQLSDAELAALRMRLAGPAAAAPASQAGQPQAPGAVEDMARSTPGAVRDAVAGVMGFPVDAANFASRAATGVRNFFGDGRATPFGNFEYPPVEAPQIPAGGSSTFRGAIDEMAGNVSPTLANALNYQPQTTPGQLWRGGVEMAAGAAVPARALGAAGATVGRLAGLGAGAGAVTEGADMAMQRAQSPEGPRTALRAILGAGTMMFGNRSAAGNLNAARMLRDRFPQMTDAEIQAALNLERAGRDQGTPLMGGEPLGPRGARIQQLTSDIRQTRQGMPIDDALAARQGQVQTAVAGPGGMLERISPDRDPVALAADRTQQTRPLYEAADLADIPPGALDGLVQAVDDAIARVGQRSDIGRQLTAYRARLTTPEGPTPPPAVPGQPAPPPVPMQVGPAATLYQETRQGIPPAGEPGQTTMQARTRGVMGEINPQLGQTLEGVNPDFAAAQQRFRDMSPRVEASERTWSPDQPAQGQPPSLARAFNDSLNSGSAIAPTNPTVGARFAQSVRGRTGEGAMTAEELNQQIRQAAQAQGVPPDPLVAQVNRQLDVLAAQGQIPGVGSPTAGRSALPAEGGRNAVSTLARALNVAKGAVLDTANSAAAGMVGRATNRRLAEVLAGPDGTERMMQMIRVGPQNELTQIQLSNLAAALRATQRPEERPR